MRAVAENFDEWRDEARRFLACGIAPDRIDWQTRDSRQQALFDDPPPPAPSSQPALPLSKHFFAMLRRVACHSDGEKWSLLYRALWRIKEGEKHLPAMASDPLIHKLRRMDAEVRRDAHKTKAFVRFRRVADGGDDHYLAWHRPDHRVLPLVGPFFQRRFSAMRWSILTPDESVAWDGERLVYGPGVPAGAEIEDNTEALWKAYYAAIFNPARIKIKAMKREMPVRHWRTLPEAALIPQLLAEAPQRVQAMIAQSEGLRQSAKDFLPDTRTLPALRQAAATCRGCTLYACATQTVFGVGNPDADIMLVGEQPGDQEDRAGEAFVGPAGQELDAILQGIGLDRDGLYITNAVKHFKFEQRGERRLHKSPDAREINACKPWLQTEIKIVKPKIIVTLGVSAAKALVHQGFSLKHDGDKLHSYDGVPVAATWHPSAILRAPQADAKLTIRRHIASTLMLARRQVGQLAAPSTIYTA